MFKLIVAEKKYETKDNVEEVIINLEYGIWIDDQKIKISINIPKIQFCRATKGVVINSQ